jgi:hypothetical protein
MSEQEEEHVMEIKAEEVIQKEDEPEEEEEEENEHKDENNNQPENKNKPEEEEEDGEGEGEEGGEIIVKHVDDHNQPQNDERTTFDITLSNDLKINVEWFIDDGNVDILFKTDSTKNLLLHWGVCRDNQQGKWSHIDKSHYPRSTTEFDAFALQTDFSNMQQGNSQRIHLNFPKENITGFNYVFKEKDSDRLYNNNNQDYHIQFN